MRTADESGLRARNNTHGLQTVRLLIRRRYFHVPERVTVIGVAKIIQKASSRSGDSLRVKMSNEIVCVFPQHRALKALWLMWCPPAALVKVKSSASSYSTGPSLSSPRRVPTSGPPRLLVLALPMRWHLPRPAGHGTNQRAGLPLTSRPCVTPRPCHCSFHF